MGIPFIFVHLGAHFPEYCRDSIEQVRLWNPDARILFVAEGCHVGKVPCEFIDLESVPISAKRAHFLKTTRLDTTFREGFWKFTTERLFVLEDVMSFMKINECIHLENDIMVYFNINEVLDRLRSTIGKKFAATYLGEKQLTYATLYIGDLYSFSQLTTYLVAQRSTENEMSLGYSFYTENPEYCTFLPTCPIQTIMKGEERDESTVGAEIFNGFWDAAAYGQYIGGIDPRNDGHKGMGFVNATCTFQSDQFVYSVGERNGLRYPIISNRMVSWPLYSLHIHSKELENYRSEKLSLNYIAHYSMKDSVGENLDKKLNALFKEKRNGVYIELGAHDGITQSNTALFEFFMDWKGLLIEASPSSYELCVKNRPASICVNAACVSSDYKESTISGDFCGNLMCSVNGTRISDGSTMISVPAKTLSSLIDEHLQGESIDLLSLDTEGYELNVLKGIDFTRHRPTYLLIEIYSDQFDDLCSYLLKVGYSLVCNFSNYNKTTNPMWDGTHNDYLFITA